MTSINKNNELIEVCRKMLVEDISLVYGARRVLDLAKEIGGVDDAIFNVIKGVVSETDDCPELSNRSKFSDEYLEKVDREVDDYIASVKSDVFDVSRV